MTKLISIVTPCYNEEENVDELYQRIADVMSTLPYEYEHIYIDNCSTDNTISKLKNIAANAAANSFVFLNLAISARRITPCCKLMAMLASPLLPIYKIHQK